MEAVPRISRAQTMDALSSQANVAGYKAVLCAAQCSTRFFPMMTTAAGTVKPATVLVLGVGVAGLQALATAKRLGARTTGFDVRPEVAEQVRSLGAKWLELGVTAAGEGGYARALTPEEQAEQQQRLTEAISGLRRGHHHRSGPGSSRHRRWSPLRRCAGCGAAAWSSTSPVRPAATANSPCQERRCCNTTSRSPSPLNLPASMPEHASELYARNVAALLEHMLTDGAASPDLSDEILDACCVTKSNNQLTETR